MQYTHTITFTSLPESVQDEAGDWVEGAPITETYPCRCEPAGANGTVKAVDGERINYDWTVYLPLPVSTIATGTPVSISMNGVTLKDKVKRFSLGRFNARVWL